MIGLHCVCSNLVSYKYKEELLKEVFHIKEGQKCCCFYSKVNALCWNKRRQIICSYSALVNQAKPFESTQSHYASCTKSRWTDSWHKLHALIHGKHSAESNSNSTRCLSPCSTSVSTFLDSWEKQRQLLCKGIILITCAWLQVGFAVSAHDPLHWEKH